MTDYELTIRGGEVLLPGGAVPADIGIRDGRIVALADHLDPGATDI